MIGGFDTVFRWSMTEQRQQIVRRVIHTAWPESDIHSDPLDGTLFVSKTPEIRRLADEFGIVEEVEPYHVNVIFEPHQVSFVDGGPGTEGAQLVKEIMVTLQANWMF
jgi:hypothetical protein